MSDVMSLLLMMAMPVLLYMGLKARMNKDAGWKKYLIAAGSVFILLAIVSRG